MKWLITAFEPFAGARTNSSLILLEKLKNIDWKGRFIFLGPLPVEFKNSWEKVRPTLEANHEIKGLLAFGQAENRAKIGLEQVALNWVDARIPDNSGHLPPMGVVQPDGADLYWSTIPWSGFLLGPHMERSYSAGTYVCNTLMYQSLAWAHPKGKKVGFVHWPVLQSQDEEVFARSPRLDDALALEEAKRILEFLLSL